ncbi:MAG TPA: 30S ribosomal protein S16, partial [bacterium]|nr:30S ribosomal protein S16 [bacterium]
MKLRLKRMGRKKISVYRVIAIDSRRQRDGKELERLGIYNPLPGQPIFQIDEDRLFYWLEQGAQPSDT